MDSRENKTVSLGTIHLCIMYGVPRHYTLSTKKASAIIHLFFIAHLLVYAHKNLLRTTK